jgi:actin related protein 2/3 complex subunit 2
MLLLDYQNVLIESLLTERFSGYVLPAPRTAIRIVYASLVIRHPANKLQSGTRIH